MNNYIYVNYISSPKFSNSQDKFEHDYWLTSIGELTYKIKNKFGKESSKLKITLCGGRALTHGYYFSSVLKNFNIFSFNDADYVIVSNRLLRSDKRTCNQKFTEKDIVNVKKLGLTLSAFRKIN